ncbi:MAG: tetratricopeptide repeat protein, partial [Thermoguttaceae bacterium]
VHGEEEAKKADEYFKKSVDDCDKILSLDPQYADAYFLKGVAAQYQGAWEDGIAAFTECVKLDPSRAEAYHHRGEIYSNIGDYMNSGLDFKKASELGYTDGSETADAASSDPADFSDLNYDAAEGDAADAEEDAEKTDAGE